jgi:ABC-type transporter Mla MlaB component
LIATITPRRDRVADRHASHRDHMSAQLEVLAGRLRLRGSIQRQDVQALCAEARRAIDALVTAEIECDVSDVKGAELPTIDVVARVALAAHQNRQAVRLRCASPELLALLGLCGLSAAVGADGEPRSGVEVGG